MKMTFKTIILLLGMASISAQADLIHTDWKTVGDKKATLDTSTGIEWMKLENTRGKSINTILADLVEGKSFYGWRLPTQDEVTSLFTSYFGESVLSITSSTTNSSLAAKGFDPAKVKAFSAMMGGGYFGSAGYWYSGGYFKRDDGQQGQGGFVMYNNIAVSSSGWYFNPETKIVPTSGNNFYGVYLVNDGGVTLSSINDPQLNINNPNAPVNNQPEPEGGGTEPVPTPVNTPLMFASLSFLWLLRTQLGKRRR